MTESKFTHVNFDATDAELAIFNAAFDRLKAENPNIDDGNLADRLCNSYQPDMTADELYEAAKF